MLPDRKEISVGDRTCVTINVRTIDLEWLARLLGEESADDFTYNVSADEVSEHEDITQLLAYEVNYAEWNDLEGPLQSNDIEYDKEWEAGGDYGAGSAYYRLVDGQYQELEVYEESKGLFEFLKEIKDLPYRDMLERINFMCHEIMPWEPAPL